MDEIKLAKWKQVFEQQIGSLEIEFDAFFVNKPFKDAYNITLNESDEWKIEVGENVPNEIKARLEQIFLATKPEDSI